MFGWSIVCFFKQKTAYEGRISDWSSAVCSSDLDAARRRHCHVGIVAGRRRQCAAAEWCGAVNGLLVLIPVALGLGDGLKHGRLARAGEIGRASCRERV